MRTTIDIDDDLMAQLKDAAHRRRASLKDLVNSALRRGVTEGATRARRPVFRCPVFHMGAPVTHAVNLDKALALAAAAEDSEVARKLELRK